MVRTRLAGNGDAALLGLAQKGDAARRAQMLTMDFCAVSSASKTFRATIISSPPTANRADPAPGSNNLRASRRRSPARNPGSDQNRQVEHLGVFAGAAHEVVVLHAMAVIGDGDDTRFFERADRREFFAGDIFGDRAGDETFTRPCSRARSWMSATVPALSIAGEVFGMQTTEVKPPRAAPSCHWRYSPWPSDLARENGRANQSVRAQLFFPWRQKFQRRRSRQVFPDGGNFSIEDENVGDGIKMVGGIHDPTAGEKQRIHRAQRSAARLTRQVQAIYYGARKFLRA